MFTLNANSPMAPLFFLYGFFAQYVLGVPAAVGNEIVVILEAL
jgi:hypothetical protein